MPRVRVGNGLVFALWGFGVFAAFVLLRHAWVTPFNERDFVAVWVAGKLAAAGHVAQVYDTETLRVVGARIAGSSVVKLAYPYPPHGLFVAVPLSFLPLWAAFLTWQAVSATLFYLAARPYFPPGIPKVLAIITPAALISVLFGQVGLFFGALWLFAFNGSAVAAALLTFKPHLGLLVAVEAARRRRVLLISAIALAILGLSAAIFGIDAWRAWFAGAAFHQASSLADRSSGLWRLQMVTPYLAYGPVGWLLFAGATIALLLRRFDVFTAATAAFLIAPYGFHYDMTVVCLGFGLLLFKHREQMPAWQVFICALIFLLPLLVVLGSWIASPLLLLGLFIQTRNPALEPSTG
ncbi:MAG TPA: glycosyltransferase family 87 protein [Sphingomicrobium sp.]|nr:glycosyltransferase family 87 protein [Sphingomicrobium sp.]